MTVAPADSWEVRVARTYREDSGRVLASLIRLLGDFDLAEEALHEAFAAAMEQWPERGMPDSPWRWLVSAGRFKAIDRIRRRARADAKQGELLRQIEELAENAEAEPEMLEDDSLRLIFVCCHPVLPPDAQVALTLREVCGLATEEIASAFLTTPPTVAQRIVRAKSRIRDAGLPYEVPDLKDLPERLETVLRVIYLVFNEGYAAHRGDSIVRTELTAEGIRLGRLLAALLPDPEVLGLLALMLFQNSRRTSRMDAAGEIVLLPDQDRSLWDHGEVEEASALLARVLAGREYGAYTLQAAIGAEHAKAATGEATDWRRIVELYDLLRLADPSPIVDLNRAAAVAMRDGPGEGVALMDGLIATGALDAYHHAFAARAELLRRLDRRDEARGDYLTALRLVGESPERRLIVRRLAELG